MTTSRWDCGIVRTSRAQRTASTCSSTTPAQSTASPGTRTHIPSSRHLMTALCGASTHRSRKPLWSSTTRTSSKRAAGPPSTAKTLLTHSLYRWATRAPWLKSTLESAPLLFPQSSSLIGFMPRASPATLSSLTFCWLATTRAAASSSTFDPHRSPAG